MPVKLKYTSYICVSCVCVCVNIDLYVGGITKTATCKAKLGRTCTKMISKHIPKNPKHFTKFTVYTYIYLGQKKNIANKRVSKVTTCCKGKQMFELK